MRIDRDLRPTDSKSTPPEGLLPDELKRWKYQRYMQDYLACIASLDDNVGRVLDYLDKQGLPGNTIVVYTSDQGFFLGDHGWFDKRFMYEESLRMPLLVRWPGVVKPGSTCDAMVLNVDFAPTLLDAAGVKVPGRHAGPELPPPAPRRVAEGLADVDVLSLLPLSAGPQGPAALRRPHAIATS